jgi:hypothetical protein
MDRSPSTSRNMNAPIKRAIARSTPTDQTTSVDVVADVEPDPPSFALIASAGAASAPVITRVALSMSPARRRRMSQIGRMVFTPICVVERLPATLTQPTEAVCVVHHGRARSNTTTAAFSGLRQEARDRAQAPCRGWAPWRQGTHGEVRSPRKAYGRRRADACRSRGSACGADRVCFDPLAC